MSWLQDVLDQHKEYESPTSFWKWSALASLSAVVKDNIYLDKFLYKMYPNIYVMLHADSGLRKGPPISMAKQLVGLVNNTKIISGRSSIQGILKEMGTAYSAPGGKITETSSCFICSNELTSSIVEDKAATDILTDLYDRNNNQDEWKSLLKMETFSLNKPTVTMLTATNEAHSRSFFQKKDMHGGYIARTFVVYESKRQRVNSLMFKPEVTTDHVYLAKYLREISKLKGEMTLSNSNRLFFKKWYEDFVESVDGLTDSTGTLNRFDDSVLKVALLLSLGNELKLEISFEALTEAITLCETLVGNIRKTTHGAGEHQYVQHKAIMMQKLLSAPNHQITRRAFNHEYWQMANSKEWDEVVISLIDAGYMTADGVGNDIVYTMSDKRVIELREYFAGRNKGREKFS